MKKSLIEKFAHYGYKVEILNGHPNYKDRKSKTYGVFDCRSNDLKIVHTHCKHLEKWLNTQISTNNG
jgi:hypothetical protein